MTKKLPRKSASQHGIQSIEVGVTLLQVLSDARGPLALKDLAGSAQMSASKAHKYLVSWARCGITQQDVVSGYYSLGPLALKMGLAALTRRDPIRLVSQAAIEFNQRHDLTTMVMIWTPRGPMIINFHNSSQLILANVGVGSIMPVLRSASGRLFLSYLPRHMTRALVDKEIKTAAQRKVADRDRVELDVEKLIMRVRSLGAGWTKGELVLGLNAMGGPIFDHQGEIVAVLGISDDTQLTDPDSPNSMLPTLLRVTSDLSRDLGFGADGSDAPLVMRTRSSGKKVLTP